MYTWTNESFRRINDILVYFCSSDTIESLKRMFGHIGVRAKSSTIVSMVDTALKVIVDPDYNIRVCFRSVTKQSRSNLMVTRSFYYKIIR